MKRLGRRLGFTLIELLVVVIIVAVLASVGAPLLAGNIIRARSSEADAGLGTVRTAMRTQFAELGIYPAFAPADGNPTQFNIGLNPGDLTGRWFEDNDYTITSDTGTYCLSATADQGGAEGVANDTDANNNAEAVGIVRSMDETGQFFNSADCT